MNEYDFRETCPACDGIGYKVVNYPPLDRNTWKFISGNIVSDCYQCAGIGRLPYTETLELEKCE